MFELTQIQALAVVHELPQRPMDQLPLGPDSAQRLRLPNKLGIELDTRSHRYTHFPLQAGSRISRSAAFWTNAERVMPRMRAASSSVSRNPFSRLRFTRTTRFRS